MINISFEDDVLHETCVDLERAEKQYGRVEAEALVTFISDAQSLENVQELFDLYGTEIIVHADDSLSAAIGTDYRAALVVVGNRFDRSSDGRIVWKSVTRLKLVEIARVP